MYDYPEVNVAVAYLYQLIQHQHAATEDLFRSSQLFQARLCDGLGSRIQQSWYPGNPEKGNAFRAVHWGIEGRTKDFDYVLVHSLGAFADQSSPSPAEFMPQALQLLPYSFILWIDPGCVSVSSPPKSANYLAWPDADDSESDNEVKVLWQAPSSQWGTGKGANARSRCNSSKSLPRGDGTHALSYLDPESGLATGCTRGSHQMLPSVSRTIINGPTAPKKNRYPPRTSKSNPCPGRDESHSDRSTSPLYRGNFMTHDNGNVGVLGGGVKLGISIRP